MARPHRMGLMLAWCGALTLGACGASEADSAPLELCDSSVQGLRITEMMPHPKSGDTDQQWIELLNDGAQPIALNRMVLSVGRPSSFRHHVLQDLTTLSPGHVIVLGGGCAPTAPVDVTLEDMCMPHDAGVVALHCRGVRVAAVTYGIADDKAPSVCEAVDIKLGAAADDAPNPGAKRCDAAPRATAGVSLSLDSDAEGRRIWHQSIGATYDGDNIGTPQAANIGRAVCQNADASWRSAHVPQQGEVRIVAVYADPPGPDDGQEWLVLRAETQRTIDLTGLSLLAVGANLKPRRWRMETWACCPMRSGEERVVRVMTAKARAQGMQARPHAGELVVWGPALPNQATHLTLTFEPSTPLAVDAPPCDEVALPKARCGAPFVRDAAPAAPPLWPPAPALAAAHIGTDF